MESTRPIFWILYDDSEVPKRSDTFFNVQALRTFARMNSLETIQSVYLLPHEKPRRTKNTYTICSRFDVLGEPAEIYSVFPREKFRDATDVLYHARQRNNAIFIAGADGSDCVRTAALISKPIFPSRYLWEDAVHFDLKQSGDLEMLRNAAESISISDFARMISGN